MTHITLTLNNYLLSPIEGLMNFVRDFNERRKYRAMVQSTIKELQRLSDNELHDIGIARCDIYSVANGDDSLIRGSK